MGVYVDTLINYGYGKGCFKGKPSCHLLADTKEELDKFARSLGLKLSWYQYKPGSVPHYDLTENKRRLAVFLGAEEINRRELLEKMRELKEKVSGGLW